MNANTETQGSGSSLNIVKWVGVFAILAATVVGNAVFDDVAVVLRALVIILMVAAALGLAAFTRQGKSFLEFARESRIEDAQSRMANPSGDHAYNPDCCGCYCRYGTGTVGTGYNSG